MYELCDRGQVIEHALFRAPQDDLKEAAEVTDKGVRFRGTSAALVNESLSHLKRGQVEGDRHWSSILKKINSVGSLMPPEELNAELRDLAARFELAARPHGAAVLVCVPMAPEARGWLRVLAEAPGVVGAWWFDGGVLVSPLDEPTTEGAVGAG